MHSLLGTVAFLFSSPVPAAGAWMTESGGPDMAMASAGRAAIATDGTTVATNPAGMADLRGPGIVAVALPATMDLEFKGTGETPGRATNEAGAMPMASAFATSQAGRWSVGFGTYSNVGLGCDFGNEWVGRRAIEDAQLVSLNIVPALAYRVSDRLDVGASLGAQYAAAKARMAVGNDATYYGPPAGLGDGQLRMDGDSWAPIANLGLIYRTGGGTKFGLAWTSTVDHSMDLDVRGSGLHPVLGMMLQQQGPARLDVSLPQQVTASAVRPIGAATLLAASAGWQQWSKFGEASMNIAGHASPMFDGGLKDTWGVAVGLRHRVSPRWTLAGGVAYDSDPSANGTMPVYFPVAEQLRIAAGADYQASASLLLRMSLSVINQGDIRIAQDSHPVPLPGIPTVTGTIGGSRIYVLGLTADYRP
ncbi:MAG: hypothetical protein FIB04_04310 [Gammaproteobacteria bacterium]|nr:hypothetical protein [Gammaproteobacteria bacterium]